MTSVHAALPEITAADRAPLKLLLAEDEPLQQKVLKRLLSLAGYDVHTATDGDEAFARLKKEPFQILVTDWDMPGMDGATLCRRLRESPLEGYLYILMLTGHSATSDLVEGLEAGADDYIRKPPEVAELLARVNAGRRIIELERNLSAAHAKIQRLSITDPLLDTFNRRYLDEKLPQEIARAVRYGRPLSLVMADIDHFKEVNDKHGHAAGDEVLRCFTKRLQASLRQSIDWVARYGGEEFVLVLPEASLEAAARVAEKVRSDCAGAPMRTSLIDCVITASFGVATLPATTASLPGCADRLLRAADAALYRSKQAGRNRVTLADIPQNAAIPTE
jgi:two-component system cell cycle response regulator